MSKFRLKRPLLCLVTDPSVPHLAESVEMALSAGVNMVQLRGYQLSALELYRLAEILQPMCQRYHAAFLVNDRLDVGLATHADGFQLGMYSLPLTVARSLVGDDYLLGASVHSLKDAQVAISSGADFLLAGTIFASRSHPNGPTSGPDLLSTIKQSFPDVALIAIGGITATNAEQAMTAGADGIALISAILHAEHVVQAVSTLRRIIDL